MADVEIILLGTGDAANTGARASQAIWLKSGQNNILIDCGPTTLYRILQQGLNPDDLDAVVFTHFHGDHFIGVVFLDLAFVLEYKRERPMFYCGPRGLEQQFSRAYAACYSEFYPEYQLLREFHEYLPQQQYLLPGNIEIATLPMLHRKESLGYRLRLHDKVIAVTGDTGWTPEVAMLAKNADLLVIECVYYRKSSASKVHLAYEILQEHRNELQAKRVVLTHYGAELMAHAEKIDFDLANDGMIISL